MVNRPSVPEIITVNSEALQTQIRDLLPSQNGFGSELQASNVITPIIDLTRAAEGSTTPELLQTALSHGSNTAFTNSAGGTVALVTSPGFYRVVGSVFAFAGGSDQTSSISVTDGSTSKTLWAIRVIGASSVQTSVSESFDIVVFLRAGDTLNSIVGASAQMAGSTRQIATGDGTLVQPVGFPL